MEGQQLIYHGAESKVFITKYKGQPAVVKIRLPKSYRQPQLDVSLNQSRLDQQHRNLIRAKAKNINVPSVLAIDPPRLYLQCLQGTSLSHLLQICSIKECSLLLKQSGGLIAKLHQANIIHGDLTSSNIMRHEGELYLIDFGLSYVKNNVQDKAVDLYVFEKALASLHPKLEELWECVIEGYGKSGVLGRLEKVRMRGRKRLAFG